MARVTSVWRVMFFVCVLTSCISPEVVTDVVYINHFFNNTLLQMHSFHLALPPKRCIVSSCNSCVLYSMWNDFWQIINYLLFWRKIKYKLMLSITSYFQICSMISVYRVVMANKPFSDLLFLWVWNICVI